MNAGDKKDETTATKPAVPPESDREQKRNLAYLVVLAGVNAGEMFKLQKDKTVVGRGPTVGPRPTTVLSFCSLNISPALTPASTTR